MRLHDNQMAKARLHSAHLTPESTWLLPYIQSKETGSERQLSSPTVIGYRAKIWTGDCPQSPCSFLTIPGKVGVVVEATSGCILKDGKIGEAQMRREVSSGCENREGLALPAQTKIWAAPLSGPDTVWFYFLQWEGKFSTTKWRVPGPVIFFLLSAVFKLTPKVENFMYLDSLVPAGAEQHFWRDRQKEEQGLGLSLLDGFLGLLLGKLGEFSKSWKFSFLRLPWHSHRLRPIHRIPGV